MSSVYSSACFKYSAIGIGMTAIMMLGGCAKNQPQDLTTLNIGFQKYGLLPIVKARGDLDAALKNKGIQVKWVEFPAGPQLLEGLNVGSVVIGESGEAPPIFAQAANANIVYVANQPAAPNAEALIVPKNSAIQTVKDLRGKRVVLNKGSNVHYLLLKLLEKNQLTLNDIQVVYLPPADARAAFEKGAVDAWVIWDPFFAAAQQQLGARVIATGQNLVSNHQFYLSDRNFAKTHPDVLNTVVQTLNQTTEWVKTHQDDAAKLLEKPTALDFNILKTSISRMGFGVTPLSPKVIEQQQQVADSFYQQKLIPQPLKIQDAIFSGTTP